MAIPSTFSYSHDMSVNFKDFEISRRQVHVKTTGVTVPITWAYTKDTLNWFSFYVLHKIKCAFQRRRFSVHSVPAKPRAWYLLWAAGHAAGVDFTASEDKADAVLYFEDKTTQTEATPLGAEANHKPTINLRCTDISKSKVASTFKTVFGYDLSVDPLTYDGPMVVKSEINGAHDGYIANGPLAPETGWVYQKLIDNSNGGYVDDIRCPTVGGDIPLIYLKQRPLNQRFENLNTRCTLHKPEDLLSAAERKTLKAFARAMHLDWGGMDVLRDRRDGRIYVVDVNKTDMGPPLALSLKDKFRSVKILSCALAAYLTQIKDQNLVNSDSAGNCQSGQNQ